VRRVRERQKERERERECKSEREGRRERETERQQERQQRKDYVTTWMDFENIMLSAKASCKRASFPFAQSSEAQHIKLQHCGEHTCMAKPLGKEGVSTHRSKHRLPLWLGGVWASDVQFRGLGAADGSHL
jgi:hypothetical protein